jgi:hypothetical protein
MQTTWSLQVHNYASLQPSRCVIPAYSSAASAVVCGTEASMQAKGTREHLSTPGHYACQFLPQLRLFRYRLYQRDPEQLLCDRKIKKMNVL